MRSRTRTVLGLGRTATRTQDTAGLERRRRALSCGGRWTASAPDANIWQWSDRRSIPAWTGLSTLHSRDVAPRRMRSGPLGCAATQRCRPPSDSTSWPPSAVRQTSCAAPAACHEPAGSARSVRRTCGGTGRVCRDRRDRHRVARLPACHRGPRHRAQPGCGQPRPTLRRARSAAGHATSQPSASFRLAGGMDAAPRKQRQRRDSSRRHRHRAYASGPTPGATRSRCSSRR